MLTGNKNTKRLLNNTIGPGKRKGGRPKTMDQRYPGIVKCD